MAHLNPLNANVIITIEGGIIGKRFCPPNCSICDDSTDDVGYVDTKEDAARELTKKGWGERDGKFFCPTCAKTLE